MVPGIPATLTLCQFLKCQSTVLLPSPPIMIRCSISGIGALPDAGGSKFLLEVRRTVPPAAKDNNHRVSTKQGNVAFQQTGNALKCLLPPCCRLLSNNGPDTGILLRVHRLRWLKLLLILLSFYFTSTICLFFLEF